MESSIRDSTCLSGALPVRLSDQNICNPGFHCPNNTITNPPEYCPPTSSCQTTRLQNQQNICPPQGLYEPIVCPPGSYCSPNSKEILPCPKGYFCPLGTMEPVKCGAVSFCGEGSVREFVLVGFVLVVIVDAVLGAYSWWAARRMKRKVALCRVQELEECQRLNKPVSLQEPLSPSSWLALDEPDDFQVADNFVSSEVQEYVASVSRCMGGGQIGLTFAFKDLTYDIPGTEIEIIHSMTGEIRGGTLCAVMGASGAGKSTFVDLLIGRKEPKTGSTYVNGQMMELSQYKKVIGYVPQEDVLLPDLTVRETMLHSARIRLPSSWTNVEVEEHVDVLLRCLGLTHVQHSLVGDSSNRSLSGGERKRVSIGVELSAAPMALFLDEPTSGLDAASALSLVKLLRQLSCAGVTVVLIIHQPRKEIFGCLDEVILLERGRKVLQRPRAEVKWCFERLGCENLEGANPADVMIDLISAGKRFSQIGPKPKRFSQLGRTFSQIGRNRASMHSAWFRDEKPLPPPPQPPKAIIAHRGAPWHLQLWLCFMRSLKQQQRRVSSFYLEIGVGAVAGLIIGLSLYSFKGLHFQGIYLPPFERLSSSVNTNTAGMIALMVCMAIGLTASPPGVKTFGEEKTLYWKEASAGHSSSAYYIGKVLATFPRIAISALHFTSFYTILATPTMSFWESYIVNLLYFYAIYGLASACSMAVSRQDGPLVAVIVCLVVSVLGGYGPSLYTVKEWHLEWFWRMCPGTWVSEAYIDRTFQRVDYLYDIQAAAAGTGFTLGRYALDTSMIFILGTVYRALAFGGLLWFGGKE